MPSARCCGVELEDAIDAARPRRRPAGTARRGRRRGRCGGGGCRAWPQTVVGGVVAARSRIGRNGSWLGSVASMAAVEVDELTVRYGDVVAVDGISFHAQAGQITAVLGPNGAGKTTTVEVLEGFRRPVGRTGSGGRPRPDRRPRRPHPPGRRDAPERRRRTRRAGGRGAAPRGRALRRTPLDPGALLERVGLTGKERRTWRQISGGEQRRLALALGARRATAGGVPRRAGLRRRPAGPPGHPRGGGRPARRRCHRGAHHPRPRRGREAGRPRGDPRPRARSSRRGAPPSSCARARSRRCASVPLPGSTWLPWPPTSAPPCTRIGPASTWWRPRAHQRLVAALTAWLAERGPPPRRPPGRAGSGSRTSSCGSVGQHPGPRSRRGAEHAGRSGDAGEAARSPSCGSS